MEVFVFGLFAALTLTFAVVVVAHRDPVKSTMSMVVTLFCLAVLFALLGAPFVATLQILIYAGAIIVLFLFVLMLLNVGREGRPPAPRPLQHWTALIGGAFFAGLVGMLLWRLYRGAGAAPLSVELVSLRRLAWNLFATYLLPFEMIGLLLFAAVVAAYVLARRPGESAQGEGGS